MADTINQVGAGAPADRVREALAGLLAIVDDSRGVAGYHLDGAIADWDEFPEVESARAMLAAAPDLASTGKFPIGSRVRKIKGSRWQGRVVGTYSTELTPEGYAVESETEHGSVQIYPAHALELVGDK